MSDRVRLYHGSKGETSRQIYAQVPLDVLLDVYPGMHALSPEMAVEDLRNLPSPCPAGTGEDRGMK